MCHSDNLDKALCGVVENQEVSNRPEEEGAILVQIFSPMAPTRGLSQSKNLIIQLPEKAVRCVEAILGDVFPNVAEVRCGFWRADKPLQARFLRRCSDFSRI